MKAYLVVGTTGEYEDFRSWNVVVSPNEDAARQYMGELNKFLRDNSVPLEPDYNCGQEPPDNPKDPQLLLNFRGFGVEYLVEEVDFLDG